MSSTLIIGIGTSGLEIIEQAQQFHYEYTGKNRPGNNVEYIYIETNENRNPKKTALGTTDIISVKVPLNGGTSTYNKLKENQLIDSSWALSPELYGDGAGGTPSYGRLSLWDPKHFANFVQSISSAHKRIGKDDTKIIIVGTLTGGTGSGLCIDIAYLVNQIVNDKKSINTRGLFLIPDALSFGSDKDLSVNAFSALSAIDKFQKNGGYRVKYLDGTEVIGNGTPFEYIQYISTQFNNNFPPLNKHDLVRVAGITLGLQIINTNQPEGGTKKHFASLIQERRIDSRGKEKIKNNLSFGFTMIQYPQYQIQELLSIKLAKEVIHNLIDNENYVDKNGNKKS
ncbi:MAG: tubulin-like doman-containing protein, partial [Bacteroidota bacterium]